MEESLSVKVGYSAASGDIDRAVHLLKKGSKIEKENDWLSIAKMAYSIYEGSGNSEAKRRIGETILAYLNKNRISLDDVMIHDRDFMDLFDTTRRKYDWLDKHNA